MNKRQVDALLPSAVQVLKDVGIATESDKNNWEISKSMRGQISSFGAAVSSGSLLSAAAFFNTQGGAASERHLLMEAINKMLAANKLIPGNVGKTLFDTIAANQKNRKMKEDVLSCAIALKLAMNLFHLKKEGPV